MNFEQHPLSALFPPMADAEYLELVDSITKIGVQNPITIYEGKVLDGWNRCRAAAEVGVECPTREFEEWIDPHDIVRAQNHARRHLTDSQRAFVAAKLANLTNGQKASSANLQSTAVSQADAAETLKVSVRSVADAAKVLREGDDELAQAVERGEVSVSAAAKVAERPKEEQREIVQQGRVKEVARAARFKGKPKRGPKAEAVRAALKAAMDRDKAQAGEAEQGEAPPDYSALDAANDQIADLQAALALATLGDVSEEDRSQAKELIAALQAQVKSLNAQVAAITQSRDYLMTENAQMKQQMAAQRRELDRLKQVTAT